MNQPTLPTGLGIGWRPELALAIDRHPSLGFVEITAEHFASANHLPAALHRLRERGLTIVPHGLGLSLGGAERIDARRVRHLADLAAAMGSPLVSEHIAFVRAGDREAGHLLPIPRTAAALRVLVDNIRAAQDLLDVPLALENISTLFDWPDRECSESDFLNEIVSRTGALLLLDVANVYANRCNLGGENAGAPFDGFPLDHIAYIHMGGGIESADDGVYHDTHAHDLPQGALDLLEQLASQKSLPGVMLERDDRFPDEAGLSAELNRIRTAIDKGASRSKGITHDR